MSEDVKGFRGWCVVELMGHTTLAGFVSEQEIAGSALVRIDVPETDKGPGFSKIVGTGAIFGITPVDEATVRTICENPQQPFSSWELQTAFRKYYAAQLEKDMPGIEDRVRRALPRRGPDDAEDEGDNVASLQEYAR